MPGTRNQVVLTPQCIVDGLVQLFGRIEYDAAGAEGSIVPARRMTTSRGLLDPWPDKTYCNPPYGKSLRDPDNQLELLIEETRIREAAKAAGKPPRFPDGLPVPKCSLKDWLKMQLAGGESVMLVPNRTHRKWLRKWRRAVDGLVELDPLKFHGWKQAFPAPLVLGYKGPEPGRFWAAFSHVGDKA